MSGMFEQEVPRDPNETSELNLSPATVKINEGFFYPSE